MPDQTLAPVSGAGTTSDPHAESGRFSVRKARERATKKHTRTSRVALVIVVGTVTASVLLTAVACSSSGSTSGLTGGSSKGTTLSPIKIFTAANINNPGIQEPGIPASAKAAVAYVNSHGGVNGHQLDLVTCDIAAQSTLGQSCARQAVSDKVAATVGLHDVFGPLTFPIYQAAGIPLIGLYPSTTNPDMVSPISNPFFAGSTASLKAAVLALKKQGTAKVGIVALQSTSATGSVNILKPFITSVGMQFAGTVTFPSAATDFTQYVEQLHTDGAQGVLMVSSGQQDAQLFHAADTLNIHDITWAPLPNITEQDLQNTTADTKMLVMSPYPPFRSAGAYPGVAQWLADLKALNTTSGAQYLGANGLNAWLAVMAFAKIAEKINGPITAASVTAALQSQKTGIDLYGLVNWQPAKSGPPSTVRSANGNYYQLVFRDHQLQLESSTPIDVYTAASR